MSEPQAILAQVAALHGPTTEWDYVQLPPKEVTVCGSCLANDDFHVVWPCQTADILIRAGWVWKVLAEGVTAA